MSTRLRTSGGALAVLLGASLALGGCTTEPRVAAEMNGRTITQSELERASEELAPVFPNASVTNFLQAILVAPYFFEAAEEEGLVVSEAEARAVLEGAYEQAGLPSGELGQEAVDVLRLYLVQQNFQTAPEVMEINERIEERIREDEISVNPRYGTLDENNFIVPGADEWIVAPGGADGEGELLPGEGVPGERTSE